MTQLWLIHMQNEGTVEEFKFLSIINHSDLQTLHQKARRSWDAQAPFAGEFRGFYEIDLSELGYTPTEAFAQHTFPQTVEGYLTIWMDR